MSEKPKSKPSSMPKCGDMGTIQFARNSVRPFPRRTNSKSRAREPKAGAKLPRDYGLLLDDIKRRIRSAQYAALKAVNQELIALYWDIGRLIVERQRGESWGLAIAEQLSKDLREEFPGTAGFSRRNIFYMRRFYLTYAARQKVQPSVAQIGWSHHVVILDKCQTHAERQFYIEMARKFGWTKNVLAIQIENQAFEKTRLNQTNFDRAVPAKYRDQAKLAVKDEYTFDFLGLGDEHSERELERAILARIERFLREMGGRFAFLGSQFRLEVGSKEHFVGLLLFHRALRRLVAIDLKIGEFKPEFVGKMQFYLAALDELVRLEDENPSIGIILCRTKERALVEYALRDSRKPIGVATYRIVKRLPQALAKELPDPKRLEQLLLDVGPLPERKAEYTRE
jgi:predicted nuclease of restriction endonuclease-like (RecB) superfamily